MNDNTEENGLENLVREYFSKKYLYEEVKEKMRGNSGQKWTFDAIIQHEDNQFGVFIKDWNRSVGINQIRLLEKACIDMGFEGGLIIGTDFSDHARNYGRLKGVQVLSESELRMKNRFS